MPDRRAGAAASSLLARIIRWRDDFVDLAFGSEPDGAAASDLDARLRRSERKKRQLQRRIDALLKQD